MSILLGLFEPVFDMMTDAPGMLGCVSPIKVDSQLVKGNILYLEVAPFPEVIPMLTLFFDSSVIEGYLSDHHNDEEDDKSSNYNSQANEHVDAANIG